MANQFAERPILEPIVLPDKWTCPLTGIVVPKVPEQNLKWRADLLTAAETDPDLQVDLFTACSQSVLVFINMMVFTLRVFDSKVGDKSDHRHLPFVTWPIQDSHILKIEHCIDEEKSLLTDKSRDMGATWSHLVVYMHRFLFRDHESHLMISRKEDAVDVLDGPPKNYPHGSLSDPGTLFGKLDYMLSRIPEWMVPRCNRKKMHLTNLDNGTRIDGESSNATAGSSDRRDSLFLDEMAKMKEAESIKRSTKDTAASRLACSTPNGAGTAFSKWRLSGQIPVYTLPWWDHPEKGANRYVKQDSLGRWQIRSPWYDKRCAEDSAKEIATELDMDHVGSGDTFFESTTVEQHRKLYAKPPKTQKAIVFFKKAMSDESIIKALRERDIKAINYSGTGHWKIWCDLAKSRPDQTKTYTISVDISKGQGASNSVMNIGCNETRELVAEFADANTPPYELARLACAAALWCGGRDKLPLIIWENNGDPGFDFGRQLVQVYHYPRIYFDKQAGTLSEKKGKRYGWRSSPEKKAAALGLLRRAYAHARILNHSSDALTEALSYIYYEGGGIGPAELVEESDSARKAHGDRVIANMLFLVALGESGKFKANAIRSTDYRAFGFRLKKFKDAKRQTKGKYPTRFNFESSAA